MKPLRLLMAAAILLPLFVWALDAWQSYGRTLRAAEQVAANAVLVLREHAYRTIESQEHIIDRTNAGLEGLSWRDIADSEVVHHFLKRVIRGSPHVNGLWLIDPEGNGVNGADFFPMRSDASDRSYYKALKEKDTLYFGEVIVGKLKGNLSANLSRRRGSPIDTFNGIILLSTNVDYFSDFWGEVAPDLPHVAALVRADGEILARYPALTSVPPRLPPDSPFMRAIGESAFRAAPAPAFDGSDRIAAYRRVGGYPVFISFGIDRDAALAPWLTATINKAALAVATIAALALVVLIAMRQARREHAALLVLRDEMSRRERAETDVAEKEALLSDLHRAQAERQAILDSLVEGLSVVDREGRVIYSNRLNANGVPDPEGAGVSGLENRTREGRVTTLNGDTVAFDDLPHRRVLAGQAVTGEELRLFGPSGEQVFRYNAAPLRDRRGVMLGAALSYEDVTDRRAAAERQELLMGELNHRVRNMLATVQAVVSLSASDDMTVQEMQQLVRGRITAMARAHSRLTEENWEGASLTGMLRDEIQPYGEERLDIHAAQDVTLRPNAAQVFALVVHELVTNAVKHGALSTPEGNVRVEWRSDFGDGKSSFVFDWRESGGPPVAAPRRKGFGSLLIERALANEVSADSTLNFDQSGLHCRIEMPAQNVIAGRSSQLAVVAPDETGSTAAADGLKGRRVLVVEDEIVVAMHVAAVIAGAGAEVIGPVATLERAMAVARRTAVDATVADLNLAGQIATPLLDLLQERGIPVLIVSGFENVSHLAERLDDLPRLRKPVSDAVLLAALYDLLNNRQPAEKSV